MAAPASPSSAARSLSQRLQQLQADCGAVFESYGATTKSLEHRERHRLQLLATEQVKALYTSTFASPAPAKVQLTEAEFEQLLRLLPSLTALSPAPTARPPLLLIVARVLHPQRHDGPTPPIADADLERHLLSLARLLHQPDPWAGGSAQNAIAIRVGAAGLLAQLMRFFVARAQEAAVEAQWRQWQAVADNALLGELRGWLGTLQNQRTQDSSTGEPHKRASAATNKNTACFNAASAEAGLCQLVDLIDALTEHPCARSLPADAWSPLLSAVVQVASAPQQAPQHLEVTYAVLQVLTHVREKGVVTPGVWRQLALEAVEKVIPHHRSDAPDPIPVSSMSASTTSYAALFLKYVHVTKSLNFLAVEESSTDSRVARDGAAHLHAVLAGLVELSASVFIESAAATDAAAATLGGNRVSLLAAVVKDLLTVRAESRSAPRQYARYVEGMLAGSTPLVPSIVQAMALESYGQMSLLAAPGVATVLATNAEILQGVFLWSIHAVIDEGLLDATRRTAVAAALPWALYDATDATLGQLHERLAVVLLSNAALPAKKDVPLLAARVIACEGLALLLHFLLFVVALYGITDEASWNVRFRDRLYAAEARVLRTVGAFDCGPPQLLRDFADALDRLSSTLGPTAAKVSALLPTSTRPSLVSAGCHGALDKLLEVIPIF